MKAKKTFVVTGATGNVGAVVAEQLRAQGTFAPISLGRCASSARLEEIPSDLRPRARKQIGHPYVHPFGLAGPKKKTMVSSVIGGGSISAASNFCRRPE